MQDIFNILELFCLLVQTMKLNQHALSKRMIENDIIWNILYFDGYFCEM